MALGVDLRGVQFLGSWPNVLAEMRKAGQRVQIVFFDASDEVLLCRFSETRRPHPMAGEEPIEEGITRERKALEGMRELADKIIDTSDMNVHELKREMEESFCQTASSRRMTLFLLSFGYKYGVPHGTDIILDVRFLPNPHFVSSLRAKTGLDREVENFVLKNEETRGFF